MRNDRIRKKDFYIKDLVRQYGVKTPLEVLMRTSYKYFWHWYLLNRQTKIYLERANIPTFQVGYEEVSLYPEILAQKICQFLDIDFDSKIVTLEAAGSHVLLGNRMRNQEEKRTRIYYDNRWFYNNEWQLPSLLFPNIMKFNTREVYSNTNTYLWYKS